MAEPIDPNASYEWRERTDPLDADPNGPEVADGIPLSMLPGLVRIAAGASWRTAEWTVGATVRGTARVVRAAAAGEPATVLIDAAGTELRGYLRGLLGMLDGNEPGSSEPPPEAATDAPPESNGTVAALRERGAELLRRSADLNLDEEIHPAYANILENLAPDEARILRLLSLEGPQPAVDVRTSRALGVGSEMVAPGLTMIGEAAGCRSLDQVQAYLNNLHRLGLIWFSREPVGDHLRYQVLEAQPIVQEAMASPGRTRTVRRSIDLTQFGKDFCQVCIPVDTAEFEAIRAEAIRDIDR